MKDIIYRNIQYLLYLYINILCNSKYCNSNIFILHKKYYYNIVIIINIININHNYKNAINVMM